MNMTAHSPVPPPFPFIWQIFSQGGGGEDENGTKINNIYTGDGDGERKWFPRTLFGAGPNVVGSVLFCSVCKGALGGERGGGGNGNLISKVGQNKDPDNCAMDSKTGGSNCRFPKRKKIFKWRESIHSLHWVKKERKDVNHPNYFKHLEIFL